MFYDFRESEFVPVCFPFGFGVLPPQLICRITPHTLVFIRFYAFLHTLYICAKFMCAIVFMACTHFAPCAIYMYTYTHKLCPSSCKMAKMLSLFERHFNASLGLGGSGTANGNGIGIGLEPCGWVAVLALFCKLWHMRRRRHYAWSFCLWYGIPSMYKSTHTHTHKRVCFYVNPYLYIYIYVYICLEPYLSPSMLPLKPLMWQAHEIKIKWWKGKRRGKFERESGKSSHNEHFPLPYLRYFIIIFLRRSCR